MFTLNWYKALGVGISGKYISLTNTSGGTGCAVYNSTSVSNMIYDAFNNGGKASYTGGSNKTPYIVFGTGNEPPTLSDIKLSGSVVSGITVTHTFSGTRADDGTNEITGIFTIANGNTTDITIGEVGVVYYDGKAAVLYERTVLDNPVTIAAGGVGQVTYTIRMSLPA